MLNSLIIKNFIIIDHLEIDFSNSFNVFTGETGAGKSLIIGALSYLVGRKADISIIKNQDKNTVIEGIFTTNNHIIIDLLQDNGIDVYDNEIIIKRVISKDKSVVKINDNNVTLGFLNKISSYLIDIHEQNDVHYLYSNNNQLKIIDSFIDDKNIFLDYELLYKDYKKLSKELEEIKKQSFSDSQIEFFKYELNELKNLNLNEEYEQELHNKENLFKSIEKNIVVNKQINEIINSDNSISNQLSLLSKLTNNDFFKEINNRIDSLLCEYNDLITDLNNSFEQFDISDSEINAVQEELFKLNKVKRKYNKNIIELNQYVNDLKTNIETYDNIDYIIQEKEKQVDCAYHLALEKAKEISQKRKDCALEIEIQLKKQFEDLLLKNVNFKINISEILLDSKGIDFVDFLISFNKGQELSSLKSSISGGENSRVLLALKTIFSKHSNIDTIIFDEIDTGVSGVVANKFGEKLLDISKSCQVFSITHLASVASYGINHYKIYKEDIENNTATKVKLLNENEKRNEIALMLFGDINETSLLASDELINKAKKYVG